jgi:hypothetical protein
MIEVLSCNIYASVCDTRIRWNFGMSYSAIGHMCLKSGIFMRGEQFEMFLMFIHARNSDSGVQLCPFIYW